MHLAKWASWHWHCVGDKQRICITSIVTVTASEEFVIHLFWLSSMTQLSCLPMPCQLLPMDNHSHTLFTAAYLYSSGPSLTMIPSNLLGALVSAAHLDMTTC